MERSGGLANHTGSITVYGDAEVLLSVSHHANADPGMTEAVVLPPLTPFPALLDANQDPPSTPARGIWSERASLVDGQP